MTYDLELLYQAAVSGAFDEDFSAKTIRELDNALDLIDFDDVSDAMLCNAAKYIEDHIYNDTTYRGSGTVALIGHSHLDIAYYWRRIHTVEKNLRTVLIHPDVFEELKEKIAAGTFEPVGAMYVEPDCNIPSAESLIRQCLYGQMFYRENFGFDVDNCWLPDVFGNSWILPQILKKSGVDYFVSNKMSTWNDTNRFPHNNFIWRGIDGSEVFACVPPTHFISWNEAEQVKENWDAFQDKETGTATMQMFGYGDGGSGCTEEMIELMHRFARLSVMPCTEHVTGKEFLHKNFTRDKNLAVWDGELYLEMHRGTFTTKSELKRLNRKLESKFRDAEMICAARRQNGEAYPAERLRKLYKLFLVNQFHDILPGSHITPVYRDAIRDLAEIDADLDDVIGNDGVYFNTLGFARTEPVFVPGAGDFVRHGVRGAYAFCSDAAFGAVSLSAGKDADWFVSSGNTVTTPFYVAEFEKDGSFLSLKEPETGREWVSGDFNRLRLYADKPGNYDAWDILPDYEDVQYPLTVEEPIHFVRADGECAEFSVRLRTGRSRWEKIIRFFRRSRAIETENVVNWHEKHRLAKAVFDVNVLSRELVCDTSAGYIRRPTHRNTSWQQARFEVCHHKYCDFSESGGGVALINEGKYGVGAKDRRISLSLLRAPIRPDPTSDEGFHDFCYVIYPHEGNHISAGINQKALEYNIPLSPADAGILPVSVPDDLFLQAVKLSEDGTMIVVRLCEQNGSRGKFLPGKTVTVLTMTEDIICETDAVEYKPFEILTIGIKL